MQAAQQQRLLAVGLAIARALLLLAVMLLWPEHRVRAFELAADLASAQTGHVTASAVSATPLLAADPASGCCAAEGEFVPGAPAQPYYDGMDQIGSTRRAFAGTTSAPAYAYDPYGAPLQTTAPVTDFGYAGLVYNADSGLSLAQYRAYNPTTGRWLSRDPIGEIGDPAANLYAYVGGSPVVWVDPAGVAGEPPPASPRPVLVTQAPTNAVGVCVAAEEAVGGTTTLFRAVSHSEFADVMESGIFRPGPNSYATGKFFAESGEDAMKWGNAMEGPGNFRILQSEFPTSTADQFMRWDRLDAIGPARFGTFDQLGQPTIKLWPGSP